MNKNKDFQALAKGSWEIGHNEYLVAKNAYDTLRPIKAEVICYLSQQAVEKSLKAILYSRGEDVPKGREGHDIIQLVRLVNKDAHLIDLNMRETRMFNNFATKTRYIEMRMDFTEDNATFALQKAEYVLQKAKEIISGHKQEPHGG